jgi:ubiquinol-cytochrome c reductase cytochrome c subunit
MNTTQWMVSLALVAGLAVAPTTAQCASAEKGKVAYVKNGCWQCHGFVGQGGVTGPKLAPDPKPFEFISVFVRHSNGPMPPYTETILSDQDLADIYAYLQSVPKSADYKSIRLLD